MYAVYHRILLIEYGDVIRTFLSKKMSLHRGDHIHTYVCVYIYIYIHTHIHIHICVYAYIY